MNEIDKRNKLDEEFFSYRETKDGRVMLYWHEKHIKTLVGKEAEKFRSRMEGLEGKEAQLLMARVTGNFKRGNERR